MRVRARVRVRIRVRVRVSMQHVSRVALETSEEADRLAYRQHDLALDPVETGDLWAREDLVRGRVRGRVWVRVRVRFRVRVSLTLTLTTNDLWPREDLSEPRRNVHVGAVDDPREGRGRPASELRVDQLAW